MLKNLKFGPKIAQNRNKIMQIMQTLHLPQSITKNGRLITESDD